jgi:hypothetical protein
MNIFGISKKDLKSELDAMKEMFPLVLGQTVYDVALKNDKGRYTKTNPSSEYSTITAVVVDEKNYFSLVKRYRRQDVFVDYCAAVNYINSVCVH